MKIVVIIFFSFSVLLILFGISISTPFLSWAGKRFNISNSSSINYKQPSSMRLTNAFIGISLFIFGLFFTIASATVLNNDNSSSEIIRAPESVIPTPKTFSAPMIPGKNPPPAIKYDNSSVYNYELDCPPNADGLNMRKQAGLNTEIMTLIPCNAIGIQDRKQRYDRDGIEWYLVEYQENTGWVAGKYLKQQATNPNKTTKSSKLIAKKRP